MITQNKKGAVADSIIGFAALLAIVLVTSVVALILYNFNEGIQASDLIGEEGKAASNLANSKFVPILNYAFLFSFISFIIFTIVTSVLIARINPIFWVLGVVLTLTGTIVFSILKFIYGELRVMNEIGPFVQAIPGAFMIFSNIEIIGVIWIFVQFTLMYKFREA